MKKIKEVIFSILRVFANLFYMGPWRPLAISVARYLYRNRTQQAAAQSVVTAWDLNAQVERLKREGFSGSFTIQPEVADEIIQNLGQVRATIIPEPHMSNIGVQKVVYDPKLQELLRLYFGTTPYLYSSSIFVTNTTQRKYNPELSACNKEFHYDLPDFKGLTLFVYLNDVDSFGGAHVVIPGSARNLTWHRLFSRFMSVSKAESLYGKDRILTITGPKGTAFLEDLVNWHKRSISNSARYALAATFTLVRRPPQQRVPQIPASLLQPFTSEHLVPQG